MARMASGRLFHRRGAALENACTELSVLKIADNACALMPDPNECTLIQDGNSSFYMKDVP